MMSRFSRLCLRCLTVGLTFLAVALVAKGWQHAWLADRDTDMFMRLAEHACFRVGTYPSPGLDTAAYPALEVPYSVYPPYAFVMFVPVFEPFGKLQGRIVIELLSLASFVVIGVYGWRLLRPAAPDASWLGAVAVSAISGNGNALALGQFSIICGGAILMQIFMLERGRSLAAGAWWALAMLKPQIGLAFAGLFLVRREWRGLAFGLALLAGMTLAACWWTDVPPRRIVEFWTLRMNMNFATEFSLPGRIAAACGVSLRVVQLATAGLLLLVPALLPRGLIAKTPTDPLVLAAIAALLGRLFFYHRFYDNVMMFPLLFVALAVAARWPTRSSIAIAAAVGASLWIPQQALAWAHCVWLRPVVWTACAALILAGHYRSIASAGEPLARAEDVA